MGQSVLAWGGGLNSTAMTVGLWQRKIVPDVMLFADTGGEKPETYRFVQVFQKWISEKRFSRLVIVKKGGVDVTLEQDCRKNEKLPSIVYGFKTCSHKFKREPQDNWSNNYLPFREAWRNGEKVVKYIGFDADEERRASITEDEKYIYKFPLIEWGWGRQECTEQVETAGFPELPHKSACFFCPSSKKREILWLYRFHPELFDRAVQMEAGAEKYNHTVEGLGRHWSWKQLGEAYKAGEIDHNGFVIRKTCRLKVLTDPDDAPCGCHDGD